jgi:hypothetical protein
MLPRRSTQGRCCQPIEAPGTRLGPMPHEPDPSAQVDAYVGGLDGWQRETAVRLRQLIHEADPAIVEAWKWSTPVFAHDGDVCAIGVFKDHLKVNFFKGATLPDPVGLFNAGLAAKISRAIDLRPGDAIDEGAFRDLVRAAAEPR